jgi:hypothetical protein
MMTRLRLMAVLDARQFGRQRLATGAEAFSLARLAVTCVRWGQLSLDGGRCLQAQQFTSLLLQLPLCRRGGAQALPIAPRRPAIATVHRLTASSCHAFPAKRTGHGAANLFLFLT